MQRMLLKKKRRVYSWRHRISSDDSDREDCDKEDYDEKKSDEESSDEEN